MRKLLLILFCAYMINLNSMHIKNGATKVPFLNQKQAIGTLIQLCLNHPTHPFSETHIYRYKNNTFIFMGSILSLTKQDIHDICKGNAIYCTNYEMVNFHEARKIGIILLGTNNLQLLKKFYSKNGVIIDPKLIKSKL